MRIGGLITGIAIAGIIFILLANFVIIFYPCCTHSKVPTTSTSLKILHNAVLQFKTDTGRYPTEEEGLWVLVERPPDVMDWSSTGYLMTTEIPPDAWNNEFVYLITPGQRTPFVIISLGGDGQKGGEGDDADLYSWDQNSRRTRQ
ncbi:MAG: type II secretion system protein GspG [Planctomycetes bacterium]|nr:type II secretion system protein GspG [Planctomycetota bacterium]